MKRKTVERLVKLLNLTRSDNDHEALSAMRNVNTLLKENALTWEKLLPVELLPEDPPPAAPAPSGTAQQWEARAAQAYGATSAFCLCALRQPETGRCSWCIYLDQVAAMQAQRGRR